MSDCGSAMGAIRAVEALLLQCGREVTLEVPSPAAGSTDFEDMPLAPCVFRKLGEQTELLVAASAVTAAAGAVGEQVALFNAPARILADNVVWRIASFAPMESAGGVLCWRLQLVR